MKIIPNHDFQKSSYFREKIAKMKLFITTVAFFMCFHAIFAQIPEGYYREIEGKWGFDLQLSLHDIISGHYIVSYNSLWTHFKNTDCKGDTIIDIYTDRPDGQANHYFIHGVEQCGNVGVGEGVCYNREHVFCQSWFGDSKGAPYSDLFHIYPVDGYVNSGRNNHPFGVVPSPTRVYSNGSKLGENRATGAPASTAFEPIDAYKGDIARTFFYMATRYLLEDAGFAASYSMTTRSQLTPWAIKMLLQWHEMDPVSAKERARNQAIFQIQNNRNPFIDYPELVKHIWGSDSLLPFYVRDTPSILSLHCINAYTIGLLFSHPLSDTSANNPTHFLLDGATYANRTVYQTDTLLLFFSEAFEDGVTYQLHVDPLWGSNGIRGNDTLLTFTFVMPKMPENSLLLAAWTFDSLVISPNTTRTIPANIMPLGDTAMLYFNGWAGSSSFTWTSQMNSFTGTLLGDPREQAFAGKDLAIVGTAANEHAIVFGFCPHNCQSLTLSFACRRTSTGFDRHTWEWSYHNFAYMPLPVVYSLTDATAKYQLFEIQLPEIQYTDSISYVFLKLTFAGATGDMGNNRLDNVVIRGTRTVSPPTRIKTWETTPFLIYPNPSRQTITIQYGDMSCLNNVKINILNIHGQMCMSRVFMSVPFTIDVHTLPAGVYIVEALLPDGQLLGREKWVKQ